LPLRGSYPEISAGNSEVLYQGSDDLERRLAYFIANPERRRATGRVLADRARHYSAATVAPRIVDVIDKTLSRE